jgi:hypothetical protein
MGHQTKAKELLKIEKLIQSLKPSLLGAEPLKPEGEGDPLHQSLCEDDRAIKSELVVNPTSHAHVRR